MYIYFSGKLIHCGCSILQYHINFKLLYIWREGETLWILKYSFLHGDSSRFWVQWKEADCNRGGDLITIKMWTVTETSATGPYSVWKTGKSVVTLLDRAISFSFALCFYSFLSSVCNDHPLLTLWVYTWPKMAYSASESM